MVYPKTKYGLYFTGVKIWQKNQEQNYWKNF